MNNKNMQFICKKSSLFKNKSKSANSDKREITFEFKKFSQSEIPSILFS